MGIQYRSSVSKEALSRLDLLLFETQALISWLLGISSSQTAQAPGGSVVVFQPTCLPQAQLTPVSIRQALTSWTMVLQDPCSCVGPHCSQQR